MGKFAALLDTAPDIEVKNGLVYIVFKGRRALALPPHTAMVTNHRIKRALDALEAENRKKVVAFK